MSTKNNAPQALINFINKAPTAWHAVDALILDLEENGFKKLEESGKWTLLPGERYFTCRNGSSIAAFVMPKDKPKTASIVGSHTDSPALKLKPHAEFRKGNMAMVGVEIYGGPLLNSWLNRDLGIAGKVVYSIEGEILESLVNIVDSPLMIPQLAIHLDRNINEQGLLLNKQQHLSAIASTGIKNENISYLEPLLERHLPPHGALLAHDLFLYPLEKASFIGYEGEMIAGYRIDNLCSAYGSMTALIEENAPLEDKIKLCISWDHEEIGSTSAEGAASSFLPNLLERIMLAVGKGRDDYLRLLASSICLSVDSGHALNPNYIDRHEPYHQPLLNEGVVLKINALKRYATDARTGGLVAELCRRENLPLQRFVVRTDMPCGSTIGPITAALTGIPTVDIGMPQLSMHSCREICGTKDYLSLQRLIKSFLSYI